MRFEEFVKANNRLSKDRAVEIALAAKDPEHYDRLHKGSGVARESYYSLIGKEMLEHSSVRRTQQVQRAENDKMKFKDVLALPTNLQLRYVKYYLTGAHLGHFFAS